MSNHYHVVLHINKAQAEAWSFDEIIHQWHKLYSGHTLSQRYLRKDKMGKAEMDRLKEMVDEWRDRLMSLSWFMRTINEPIARLANAEDNCTGHFWAPVFAPANPAYHTSCIYLKNCSCIFKIPYILYIRADSHHRPYSMKPLLRPIWPEI
ncbi:Transposase and inactivated derivatives [hydrothermal vent metagenome]|uniref:Transposase and inactivated derivatives n=1 Tax=hydrothermal vent metagenome TaxID=652676 RepID=A0A3B0YG19_9ZZZZ